jgi:predicted ribosome quality control (RQC) complex YloA/Tae2 family protein
LLPKTEAEEKGLGGEEALLDISGRSRKRQLELVKEFNILNVPCVGGGCLLTDKEFAHKLRDLFEHKKRVTVKEVNLLKVGRHFRFGENKIIVGRNEAENSILTRTKRKADLVFEVPNCGSPTTLLQGPKTRKAIQTAAALTAYHSDKKDDGQIEVTYGIDKLDKKITVNRLVLVEVDALRI